MLHLTHLVQDGSTSQRGQGLPQVCILAKGGWSLGTRQKAGKMANMFYIVHYCLTIVHYWSLLFIKYVHSCSIFRVDGRLLYIGWLSFERSQKWDACVHTSFLELDRAQTSRKNNKTKSGSPCRNPRCSCSRNLSPNPAISKQLPLLPLCDWRRYTVLPANATAAPAQLGLTNRTMKVVILWCFIIVYTKIWDITLLICSNLWLKLVLWEMLLNNVKQIHWCHLYPQSYCPTAWIQWILAATRNPPPLQHNQKHSAPERLPWLQNPPLFSRPPTSRRDTTARSKSSKTLAKSSWISLTVILTADFSLDV